MASPPRRHRITRGDTTARGYGHTHQQERKRWRRAVQAGKVDCWRCNQPIQPDQPWDLGHDDNDRSKYRGPEHVACNRNPKNRRIANPEPTQRTQW